MGAMKNDKLTLILASRSPRRMELLTMAGIPFETAAADCDEEAILAELRAGSPSIGERTLVEELALAKAREIFGRFPDSLILAADTIVTLDGIIFGKPKDEEDARRMLLTLAGRTHTVDTGVALLSKEGKEVFSQASLVTFRPRTRALEALIHKYAATGLPMDKAGAYGIQELGGLLIEKIEGDFFSVMGLPIAEVYARLQNYPL